MHIKLRIHMHIQIHVIVHNNIWKAKHNHSKDTFFTKGTLTDVWNALEAPIPPILKFKKQKSDLPNSVEIEVISKVSHPWDWSSILCLYVAI